MASRDKRRAIRPWHATIREYGQTRSLGYHATQEEAVACEEREREVYRAEVRREFPSKAHWQRYA